MRKPLLIIIIVLFISPALQAQVTKKSDPAALHSVSGIVNEMLRLISGSKGEVRNFEALNHLFLPTAHFTILNTSDSLSQPIETISLKEFIELMHDEDYEKGYIEYEIGRTVNEYNGLANVFQAFEAKDATGRMERGMNSYQLVYSKGRWWIANVMWTLETPKKKIPVKYLKK